MLWVGSWWEQSSLQIGREWQACPDTLWEEYWHLETALESAWTQWFGELPSLMARCGWSLLLIFISLWVLVLDHLLNYSRKVTHRCRCPLQTVVCMLMPIFVLLCYFLWFTWIALLCDLRHVLAISIEELCSVMCFSLCKLLTVFFSAMKLVMVVDARDPLFYRCPDLEVLLIVVFV